MSRFCAKPTCSDLAQRWFDIAAAEREVIERAEPTASSIALCDAHAARFSTPSGWTFTASAPVEIEMVEPQAPSQLETALVRDHAPRRARSRQHDRDTPWFLALSDAPAIDAPADTETVGSEEAEGDETSAAPGAGPLLHRAFHGPDREIDTARAGKAKEAHPGAKVYQNWKKLLEKEANNFDVAIVATPDHMHAPIAMTYLGSGIWS